MADIKKEIEKPECLLEDHLEYLDDLRESGITTMFGARPYLLDEFSELTDKDSSTILSYWMHTFSERHKVEEKDEDLS